MVIKKNNENVSVAEKNGYTAEKVRKAKRYMLEISRNRRGFPVEKLVEYYNELRNMHDIPTNCRPCMTAKYINSIENYVKYGEMTLIACGIATKEELEPDYEPKSDEPKKVKKVKKDEEA